MAEDFDELTQSSDTATDDSPTSGYRHASLLIQKLDSATLDKVSQLEMERGGVEQLSGGSKDVKSALERNQLELQSEVPNLKFQLKQEQEHRRNATMMYNTTRDQLRRMEEQHQGEVQDKQKVELTLRNLELEMRTLVTA
ncbi:ankyrin repeat domain-containing protein 26-like [Pseudochaenichthys georgianus]|uniref:ankyrin repeat domain-containing protein 26-like n=1 Tax=Pseudochaenichthys georgianus TaxID=52239 RepID=UPI0039C35975